MVHKAVALLSGGLDSAVAAAVAKSRGFKLYALSVDYGQRHQREIRAAKKLAKSLGAVEHKIFDVDLGKFGGSALTDKKKKIPTGRDSQIGWDIPATYVPARNTVLLSLGLAWAEVIGAEAIFIGAHSLDYSGYPDCRPEFFKAFQKVSEVGTKRGVEGGAVRIETPLLRMKKTDIIMLGLQLGVPFKHTWSCYHGGEKACGECDSCVIRIKAFKDAGMEDPIPYAKR